MKLRTHAADRRSTTSPLRTGVRAGQIQPHEFADTKIDKFQHREQFGQTSSP